MSSLPNSGLMSSGDPDPLLSAFFQYFRASSSPSSSNDGQAFDALMKSLHSSRLPLTTPTPTSDPRLRGHTRAVPAAWATDPPTASPTAAIVPPRPPSPARLPEFAADLPPAESLLTAAELAALVTEPTAAAPCKCAEPAASPEGAVSPIELSRPTPESEPAQPATTLKEETPSEHCVDCHHSAPPSDTERPPLPSAVPLDPVAARVFAKLQASSTAPLDPARVMGAVKAAQQAVAIRRKAQVPPPAARSRGAQHGKPAATGVPRRSSSTSSESSDSSSSISSTSSSSSDDDGAPLPSKKRQKSAIPKPKTSKKKRSVACPKENAQLPTPTPAPPTPTPPTMPRPPVPWMAVPSAWHQYAYWAWAMFQQTMVTQPRPPPAQFYSLPVPQPVFMPQPSLTACVPQPTFTPQPTFVPQPPLTSLPYGQSPIPGVLPARTSLPPIPPNLPPLHFPLPLKPDQRKPF
ncbi:hypothetical protein PAPYR_10884 [Paratrimastix pyriformis]|uniref:Uncharacterized protein n=1 Tax=Paratrimastix pyriformis TaxID=342808 RepID=A0ABQ8U6U7_9EUKA|nr:hypothetical protein PAPYR_10884 [Paratrimastix pyriformis]